MTNFHGNQFQILQALRNDFKAISHEEITVDNTVKKLTVPEAAKYALITVESTASGKIIRFWLDGSAPSATSGLFKSVNEAFDITEAQNLKGFRVTQAQAGTHKLMVQYFA